MGIDTETETAGLNPNDGATAAVAATPNEDGLKAG